MEPMLVSIKETCALLGLGRTTVYKMIDANEIDTVKFGRRRLVKYREIMKLIETKK